VTGELLVNRTSVSLLDRLKSARPDASDWNRVQGIYLPLIESWLRRVPGLGDESADMAQGERRMETYPWLSDCRTHWQSVPVNVDLPVA